jgi:hypothetical protein
MKGGGNNKSKKKRSRIDSRANSPQINFPSDAVTKNSHQSPYLQYFITHVIHIASFNSFVLMHI